jgi:hypothetical protein
MVVWGGLVSARIGASADDPTDGARYDPSTDRWVTIAPTTLRARGGEVAVWTGVEMIVWGGSFWPSSLPEHFADGARYEPPHN